ncbi:MAG: hypothetical protein MI717_07425 [Spirochaetales bacterium]|nr:hypothetical protein [Spirochaetales bacterium]
MTSAQKEVDKRMTRAIMEYGLIQHGDRVLIALSGGKDSLALAWNLAMKSKGFSIPFQACALHVDSGMGSPTHLQDLRCLMESWKLPLEILPHPIKNHQLQKDTPTCFGCARERRRILLDYAQREGYTKVALGHHMDDSLITLLMNMTWNAQLAAMPPLLKPEQSQAPSIIRPLILLQESVIERMVKQQNWPVDSCVCPWAGDSRRQEVAKVLQQLTGGSQRKLWNMWKSLNSIQPDRLP